VFLPQVLDVACGLCYVHSQGLVYKHLQPLYVLLSQHLRAKLSVEGFLVDCMDDPRTLQGTDVTDNSVSTLGTSENLYQAPEVMDGSVSHSKSSDVYSFSLVMYEIACRQYMYDGEDGCEQDAFKIAFKAMMGSRPVFSSNIPPSFVDLATRSWQKEQASRPSLPSVVQELKDMLSKCV
jgi:serine/threonine protein kinase